MADESARHNVLTGNFATVLHMHLKSTSCQSYALRMKVKVGQNYFYPDVLVDCSDVDGYSTETPTLIIEVLSKSTRKLDETTKWLLYLQIPTLLEYILVEQDCGLKSRGVVRVGSPCAIF
ncbi:MAG TPA: Uma2 family endonuclease [Agitococcus sp.]|nr:Uma2 family endonuclease [Agitococcus sp.]HNC04423.1 Uma2 family endonuclease [Agitococcus sp.]HNC85716.1 Uma2 family endonuclease [Agitococcus sp.]HNN29563.1 Uma2 family endonuclease [Agitococcus sp.]